MSILVEFGKASNSTIKSIVQEVYCKNDILVNIEYREQDLTDEFLVPLSELEPLDENDVERAQAIGDWQYWLAQGNELIDPDTYEEY